MTSLQQLFSGSLAPSVLAEIHQLANAAFGECFTQDDLEHALGGTHVLVREGGCLVAHGAVVQRTLHIGNHTVRAGYVEAVATVPARQGNGLGTAVMKRLGEVIQKRYDLGALSTDTPAFYERLGWERWRGPSWVIRADGERERSADEDDGLMVLRCQATTQLDLTWPIACHDRPGDAW